MNYFELYLPCLETEQSEIWMAELSELPFESFALEETCLKAYIRQDQLEIVRDELDKFLRSTGVQHNLTEIETVNWNSIWESGFEPVVIENKCIIRAPFHEIPDPNMLDIIIMPKMSFGTGHHATTWLMVSEMLRSKPEGLNGLDMGSGTGVLAVVAVKLGASHMDAIDIDEWAFQNCMENIGVNNVAGKITPILGNADALGDKKYDFVLANINRNIILNDLGKYTGSLNEGGFIIISGILEGDIEVIEGKAASLGLKKRNISKKDGWAAVNFDL